MTARDVDGGATLAATLEVARGFMGRFMGLMGRPSLADGHGLWLPGDNGIHMFFMRFPIDVLFVGRDGRVVKACPNVRPWRVAAAWRAFAVVEGPAGTISATGTRAGDLLAVRERT
jgi:uncharacterized membrane protein (UPF0127 family)